MEGMAVTLAFRTSAAGGRHWSSRLVAPRSGDLPSLLSLPRTLSSSSPVQKFGIVPTNVAAGDRLLRAVEATPCVVVASQHSNARIRKFNRHSRFGEPLETTDCEEDDELCQALLPDVHVLKREELEKDISTHQSFRKEKNRTSSSKRLDLVANASGVRGNSLEATGLASHYDHPSPKVQMKPTAATGRTVKKSVVQRFRNGRYAEDSFLTTSTWEEQAYQIIQQQKLRDASAIRVLPAEAPRPLLEHVSSQAWTPSSKLSNVLPNVSKDAENLEADEIIYLLTRLGLEEKCQPLLEYLHSFGLREQEFTRILDRHKASLQANVNSVKERVEFLLALGVQSQDVRKLIVRHPQIIEYRVDQTMRPRILFLKSLGLDDSKIGKVITASPCLLECSLERSVQPRVDYLVKNLGIRIEDVGKIVLRSPQILTQSIEESLEPRLDFFLNVLKLPRQALAKMVIRHPQLFHYSIEFGIQPRVKYLRSIGMSNDDIGKVLTRLTQILSLSVKNSLQPKFNYLVEELKGNSQTVTSFPAYFSLSLDQRIVPRHRYLMTLQRAPRGPFPMRLLAISDAAFCRWADSSLEAYDKFRHDLLLTSFARKFEWKNNVHL